MLRMRLTRVGSKKRPAYRVVVADSHAPRDGRHVDIVGQYDPMTKPSTVNIDVERAVKWLRNGAQPSERVRILLRHSGVLKAHEEARLADKRARKDAAQPTPVRVAKEAADVAKTAFKVIVQRAAQAADVVADAAGTAAGALADASRRGRTAVKSAGKGASKGGSKSGSKSAAKAPVAAKRATKSTAAAKSAEKTAARKAAAKSAKSASKSE